MFHLHLSSYNLFNMIPLETFIDWKIFHREVYGEEVINYVWFFCIVVLSLLFKRYIVGILTWISARLASRTGFSDYQKQIRDLLFRPAERLVQIIMFFIAASQISNVMDQIVIYHSLNKHDNGFKVKMGDLVEHILLLLFIVFLIQVINQVIEMIFQINFKKAKEEQNNSQLQLLPLMRDLGKMLIWMAGLFWILGSVFHVNIPALITGLGIGGVAIALAAKETVENFIAAFSILTDKPFTVGDWVKLGDLEGNVERIGFRSTRIRGFDGTEIVVPNSKLVTQNLINYNRSGKLGINLTYHIGYHLSSEQLLKLRNELREILELSAPILQPPDVMIDVFNVYTVQIVVRFFIPIPLPTEYNFFILRTDVSMKIYNKISQYTRLGVNIETAGEVIKQPKAE